jgi:hypothetical protein
MLKGRVWLMELSALEGSRSSYLETNPQLWFPLEILQQLLLCHLCRHGRGQTQSHQTSHLVTMEALNFGGLLLKNSPSMGFSRLFF